MVNYFVIFVKMSNL